MQMVVEKGRINSSQIFPLSDRLDHTAIKGSLHVIVLLLRGKRVYRYVGIFGSEYIKKGKTSGSVHRGDEYIVEKVEDALVLDSRDEAEKYVHNLKKLGIRLDGGVEVRFEVVPLSDFYELKWVAYYSDNVGTMEIRNRLVVRNRKGVSSLIMFRVFDTEVAARDGLAEHIKGMIADKEKELRELFGKLKEVLPNSVEYIRGL